MITILNKQQSLVKDSNNKYPNLCYGVCLSSDEKPLNWENGSVLFEIDTSNKYMFERTQKQWIQVSNYQGGSGESYSGAILRI